MKKSLFLLILTVCPLFAWSQSFYCKTVGIEEGLSQSSVTSVAYNGSSLWIGTRYGLNELRGNTVRKHMEEGASSLSGTYIHFLHVDSDSSLWVSTENGLSKYDRTTNSFAAAFPDIAYSALDLSDGILFGTNRGLMKIVRSTGLPESVNEIDGAFVIGLHEYGEHILIVDRGLGVFLDTMDNPVVIPEIRGNVLMASVLDGDVLYLATFHEGLFVVNLLDRSVRKYTTENSGLSFDVILSLLLVDGNLWLGTDGGGICIFHPETNTISPFNDYFIHHTGLLPDNSVTTLYRDPHGNVWVGSVRNGLFGLKEAGIKSLAARGPGSLNSLSHNVVIALHEDSEGIVWVGTDGGGLNRYDPQSGDVTWVESMKEEKVISISDFDANRLLVSLYNRGYWLLDKRTGRRESFVIVDRVTNADECFTGNAPCSYQFEESQNLILAIHVYIYDRLNRRFVQLNQGPHYPVSGMTAVGDDGHGKVYAYSSFGLFEVDVYSMYTKCILEKDGINTASYIDGEVWFGTDSGLKRLDVVTGTVRDVNSSFFSRVTQICKGADNVLWIAADNTLFRYKDGTFKQYGENEGFASNEILSCMVSQSGEKIYLGGTKGLVEIDSEVRQADVSPKNLQLLGVTLKGKPVSVEGDELSVPYDFSSMSVYVDLNGSDPFEKVMYRYKVNGSNSSVVETYDDHVLLHSLKAGRYDIEASYMMGDGSWSSPKLIVRLNVENPWYKSPMFLGALASLLFLGLVFTFIYIYKVKVRRLRENMNSMDPSFVGRLDSYIEDNMSNSDLDVAIMASDFAMSRAGLYNKVKNTTGKAVGEYVMEKRMTVAKALLKDTNLSIVEISERVGFASPKYFSTRFKEINNCSPNAYRKQSRESK